jgi:hypothetical protein
MCKSDMIAIDQQYKNTEAVTYLQRLNHYNEISQGQVTYNAGLADI